MNKFFTALVSKLPVSVQPYAKALVPLAIGAVLVLQDLTVTVQEVDSLKTIAGSVAVSLIVLVVPNLGSNK